MKRIFAPTALCFLLALIMGSGAVFSADLSLRETVRMVSEVVNVFPLDVYTGTTLCEYQDWNCRYDLTYKEFRQNYVLYVTARHATAEEALECVEQLSTMTPKEKALTCAALITFVNARREVEENDSGVGPVQLLAKDGTAESSVFSDAQKEFVLEKLKKELDDQNVAFSKIDDPDLSSRWEENVREECGYFMARPHMCSVITAARASHDLYQYPKTPKRDGKRLLTEDDKQTPLGINPRELYLFDAWNNETEQLPIEFLCAIVLLHAAYDYAQLDNPEYFQYDSEVNEEGNTLELTERDVVVPQFLERPVSNKDVVSESSYRQASNSAFVRTRMMIPLGEGAIMNAFLRTQFIALRNGRPVIDGPICGNSSERDVLVSEVVQKAINALSSK